MLTFHVLPHKSIGPAGLGMTRSAIRSVLGEPSCVQGAHEKWGIEFPEKDFFYDNSFQVSYDLEQRTEFIEVASHRSYAVMFEGADVHQTMWDELMKILGEQADPDRTYSGFPDYVFFPALNLTLSLNLERGNCEAVGISSKSYLNSDDG